MLESNWEGPRKILNQNETMTNKQTFINQFDFLVFKSTQPRQTIAPIEKISFIPMRHQ